MCIAKWADTPTSEPRTFETSLESFPDWRPRHLLESPSAEALTNIRQHGALLLGQPQAIWKMCSECSVLRGKILDLQQQSWFTSPLAQAEPELIADLSSTLHLQQF